MKATITLSELSNLLHEATPAGTNPEVEVYSVDGDRLFIDAIYFDVVPGGGVLVLDVKKAA